MTAAPTRSPSSAWRGTEERPGRRLPGFLIAGIVLLALAAGAYLIYRGADSGDVAPGLAGAAIAGAALLALPGFFVVAPNEAMVLILFGPLRRLRAGLGPVVDEPAHGRLPRDDLPAGAQLPEPALQGQRRIGQPDRDRGGGRLAVVDTARAVFDVEDFEQFVVVPERDGDPPPGVLYPYDDFQEGAPSLRGKPRGVRLPAPGAADRLAAAGIEVLEAR
jgi:hypothetical protein